MIGPPPAIEAQGLGRDYGSTRALDRLDLVVSPGSLVGLLGPNGAGKTTAMLLLGTLLRPTRGFARIFGYDTVGQRAAVRRRLGLVFQEASVDPLLTVTENLLFAARLSGLGGAGARQAAGRAIERLGLEPQAGITAGQLSGGWRRMLDLARATLHQPDMLILDEPTVGLDPEHRDRIWSLLHDQRRSLGTTLLFSTHYLSEAEPADEVVLLSFGRVMARGSPSTLQESLGREVAEIEGPGAPGLVARLRDIGAVKTVIQTRRGFRVGVTDAREKVIELAGSTAGLERFALRPATLEDVYFSRTLSEAGDAGHIFGSGKW